MQFLDHDFRQSMEAGLDSYFLNLRDGDSILIERANLSGNIPYDFMVYPENLMATLRLAGVDKARNGRAIISSSTMPQNFESECVQQSALGIK